jgi:hypothetical protein
VRDDVSIDNETFLFIDFVNLKIKSTQSFRDAHRDRMCVRMFIDMSAHICINISICNVLKKREKTPFYNLDNLTMQD